MKAKELHRTTDPQTSKDAAGKAVKKAQKVHKLLLMKIEIKERLQKTYQGEVKGSIWKDFKTYSNLWEVEGPTVRKRFGELAPMGYIEPTGGKSQGCRLFRLTEKGKAKAETLKNKQGPQPRK